MTELEAFLRLWHIPKVGPRTFNFLLDKYPNLCDIFSTPVNELIKNEVPKQIAKAIVNENSEEYLNDITWLKSSQNNKITLINNPNYPSLLKEICNPPPILYSIGNTELLTSPVTFAIVGARSASTLGKKIAYEFSQQLASIGAVVISGLAKGIDAQAHNGALNINRKSTMAVLANGLDRIYPREHTDIAKKISQESLLLSEYAPGVKPLPQHFPRRNRIISGLALGTLVIEAANKSGSLITAKYALEQGREVFAVPGPINNPKNEGCHQLIQQGAKLTGKVEDIIIEIAPMIESKQAVTTKKCINNSHNLNDDLKTFLNYLEYTPLSMEKIIEKSGLTPEQVCSMLTELEMGGQIAADAFGQYSRI